MSAGPTTSTWYWWRLPAGERERLRLAVGQVDGVQVLQLLNRYQIAPHPLSLCCDLEAAVAHARAYLDYPENRLVP